MVRTALGALAGAVIGGVLLFLVAQIGDPAVVYYLVHTPGTSGFQDAINYQAVMSRFAIIMGVCSGAVAGAIAGAVRK
jgi:hypothetical protein